MSIYKISEMQVKKYRSRLKNTFGLSISGTLYLYQSTFNDSANSSSVGVIKYGTNILQVFKNYDGFNDYRQTRVWKIPTTGSTTTYSRTSISSDNASSSMYLKGDKYIFNYTELTVNYRWELDLVAGTWASYANHDTSGTVIGNTAIDYNGYSTQAGVNVSGSYTFQNYLTFTK